MLNIIDNFSISGSDYNYNNEITVSNIQDEIFFPDVEKIAKLHGFDYKRRNDKFSNYTYLGEFMQNIYPSTELVIPIIYENKSNNKLDNSSVIHKINYLCIAAKNERINSPYVTNDEGKIKNNDTSYPNKVGLSKLMTVDKAASCKLFRLTLYYDRNDFNKKITFDTCEIEFVARMEYGNSGNSNNDYSTILTNEHFSIYPEYGVFIYNERKNNRFPLIPLNYKDYMVNDKGNCEISPVNITNSLIGYNLKNPFNTDVIHYIDENNTDVGMGKWTKDFYEIEDYWYCHCNNKIFRISNT